MAPSDTPEDPGRRRRDGPAITGLGRERRNRPTGGVATLEDLVIRPWPRQRARRTRWIVVAVLVAAPVIATGVTWFSVASDRTSTVVEPAGRSADALLLVEATALGVDLERNELVLRLVFRPQGELVDGDVLAEPVDVAVNDVANNALLRFAEGEVMEPRTVAISVSGSQLLRYPFDDYEARLVLVASAEERGDEPLELDMSLDVSLVDFSVVADAQRSANAASIDLEMSRRSAVVVWVVFFMVVVWAIALVSASTTWFIVVFSDEAPFWVYALLAAILFALPTLRAGLPGAPPYGSLVDWSAFYWGIAIVAASLVTLLVVWNVEARVRVREARVAEEGRRSDEDPVSDPSRGP